MSNNSIAPFFVGQEVVCIKEGSRRNGNNSYVVKGHHYVIRALKRCPNCSLWLVDIGFNPTTKMQRCSECNELFLADGVLWARAYLFAPIITNFQSITFEKVIEQELASVN